MTFIRNSRPIVATACKEYVVWRTRDRAIDWFVAEDGEFVRFAPGADGLYRSRVFPGLWLDPAALIARRPGRRWSRVNREAAPTSPEHAAFVEHSEQAAAPKPAAGG